MGNTTPFCFVAINLYAAVRSYDEYCIDLGYADGSVDDYASTFVSCVKVYFDPKHIYIEDFVSDETGHWYTCDGCDEKIDFASHTEDDGTVTVEPTEDSEGEKVYKCTVCGHTTRTEVVSKLEQADGIEVNSINFPDEVFIQYVSENFDKDNNGWLSESEISVVTRIDVDDKNIQSLKGIEYFTELTDLYCDKNKLTSLDIAQNTKLEVLCCSKNQFTSLDINSNTLLEYLWCDNNKLTSLNLSNNKKLGYLWCGFNELTLLDVSNNTALTFLSCEFNKLISLDVNQNIALKDLYCEENQLTSLDVSKNAVLEDLVLCYNEITSLDVSKNTALTRLDCKGNQLTSLDVGNNTALTSFYCNNNSYNIGEACGAYDLKNLPVGFDITKASNWQGASLKNDKLTEMDGTGTITYEYDCGNNHTATFNLIYTPVEHSYDDGVVTTEPTEQAEGEKTYTCTICGATKTEIIEKLEGGNNNPTEPSEPSSPSQPQQPETSESETNIDVKKGWGNVIKVINNADENSKINVDMGNSTNIPKNVMNAIRGKNVDIVLDMGDGITWTINGKDVTNPQSVDFSVIKKKNSIPEDMISDPSNTIPLVLAHNGNFGCSATLSIDLKGNDNKVANLYYYNTKTKELEFVDSSVIINGKASLVFYTHLGLGNSYKRYVCGV